MRVHFYSASIVCSVPLGVDFTFMDHSFKPRAIYGSLVASQPLLCFLIREYSCIGTHESAYGMVPYLPAQ